MNNATNNNQKSLPKRVAIIYSEVEREYFPTETQYLTEKNARQDAHLVGKYLEKFGVSPFYYPGTADLVERIKKEKPDMIINLVGSIRGQEYLSSAIPGMLEIIGIPYTGAGILGESLAYNKFLVKKLLQQNGVPVPFYQLFNSASDNLNPELRFPLISKLNEIHGSVEITKESVSENEKALKERIKFLIGTYNQAILVEEFIVGREITTILLEGFKKKVYLAEKIFTDKTRKYSFTTFEDQWEETRRPAFYYRKYKDPLLKEYVKKSFNILKMNDYAKFDIRLDISGRYYFIDANSNPAFGPKEADCALTNILELYGVSFPEILKRLLLNTMQQNSF